MKIHKGQERTKKMKSLRQDVIDYIRKTYKDEMEYPWMRYPDYGVFRHKDNQKWYALMMNIPRARLGVKGDGIVDVLNIKLGDLLTRDFLIQREGFFPGYHIARGNWISILLDGTVDLAEVCHLIDASYKVTASAKTRKAIRPPKEWIIPSIRNTTTAFTPSMIRMRSNGSREPASRRMISSSCMSGFPFQRSCTNVWSRKRTFPGILRQKA